MSKTVKSLESIPSVKTETTLSDVLKILKSQDNKLVIISTKLSVQVKKLICL